MILCFLKDPVISIVAAGTMLKLFGYVFFAFWMSCSCNDNHPTNVGISLVGGIAQHYSAKTESHIFAACSPP